MARRPDPERIYQGRRAAHVNRLFQAERMLPERAEALVAAWEAEAARRGRSRDAATFWTEERRVDGGAASALNEAIP